MNISLVLLPLLLFVAFARWVIVTVVVVTVMRMASVVMVVEMVIGDVMMVVLKSQKLRCSEEEGGGGSIKAGQEAKCTKCLKAPYLARHTSFCAKCSDQVRISPGNL